MNVVAFYKEMTGLGIREEQKTPFTLTLVRLPALFLVTSS